MPNPKFLNSQSKLRQKRIRKRKLKILLYCFLAIVCSAGIFYAVFFSGYLKIREVSVTGVGDPISGEIRRIVFSAISGNKLFLPRDNILIFSGRQSIETIEKTFPVLEDVSAKKRFPNKIIIQAKERQKTGIVCGESGDKTKCFYFDGHGVIFEESPEIIGANILILKDNSAFNSSLPDKKYDEKTIGFIQDIKKDFLDKAGIGTAYFYFLNSSGDLAAHTDKNFEIYLAANDQLPAEQARVLKSILDNEIKDKISALDYIDLRVENRAYYKLRND